MTSTKQIVIAALFSASTSAVSLRYRPPPGSVPWQIPVTVPEFEDVKNHPVNYFVPNFGVDTEINDTTDSIKQSEQVLKKKFNASWKATKNPLNPRDYFVPDFGVDHDIKATKSSIAQAEQAVGSTLHADFESKKNPHNPRDYFVPDFGVDHDIENVSHAIELSEKKLDHKLQASWEAKENPVNPRDYFVPDFGVDRDIKWTKGSIEQSEKALSHQWNPVKNGDYWQNMPAADANSSYVFSNSSPEYSAATKVPGNFAQVSAPADKTNIQLESDPICSSAGCTQYKQPEAGPGYPMDYFVPDFGVDQDIKASFTGLKVAQEIVGHKWDWKREPKPEGDPSYKVPDFGIDEEIKYAQDGIKWAQTELNHKWQPKQDANGFWGLPEAADNNSYVYQ